MTAHKRVIGRRGLLAATAGIVATVLLAPAASATPATTATDGRQADAHRALERAAHPLRSTEPGGNTGDLRALGAMVGDARVVGLGEATQQALDLVTANKGTGGDAYEWAEQHARNIAQTFAFTSLDLADPQSVSAAELLRDQAMADNTAWWQRRTGDKMLLSAHNGHVGYLSTDPVMYPTTQGVFLRNALGRDYAAIGFTFAQGSFLTATTFGGAWDKVTVPAAAPDMHEYTLDLVRHRDYYLDLRTLPVAGRNWLNTPAPSTTPVRPSRTTRSPPSQSARPTTSSST